MFVRIRKKYDAISQIRSKDTDMVLGYIYFTKNPDGTIQITGNLRGLPPGPHGFHIHESGNPKDCCGKLGGHYNPFNQRHGSRITYDIFGNIVTNYDRHVGDLGNIFVAQDGTARFSFSDPLIKLDGPYSVIGRSLVIHKNRDDLGLSNHPESLTTGNSGARIAYGIIGIN